MNPSCNLDPPCLSSRRVRYVLDVNNSSSSGSFLNTRRSVYADQHEAEQHATTAGVQVQVEYQCPADGVWRYLGSYSV